MQPELLTTLANLLREHGPAVALTGAGLSTESGVPDFRSPGGLYESLDPLEYLSVDALSRHPGRFWSGFAEVFGPALEAQPNAGHRALARLEAAGHLLGVATQNLDGLHQKAGSRRVWELHGHLRTTRCTRCAARLPLPAALAQLSDRPVPRCPGCGGDLRPDVVLFGDPLPAEFEEAFREARGCGLVLAVGTSLAVFPAAEIAYQAQRLALINRDPTPADRDARVVLHAEAGETLTALARALCGTEGSLPVVASLL